MRRMLRHTLILLRQHSWQQQEIVNFASALDSAAIDGLNDHIPDGLRFHLIDIYLEELNSVGEGKVVFFMFLSCHLILSLFTLFACLESILPPHPVHNDVGNIEAVRTRPDTSRSDKNNIIMARNVCLLKRRADVERAQTFSSTTCPDCM